MARRLIAVFLAPALALCLAAGCSSTAMSGAGGSTGAGGAGADGGDVCASLAAAYADAYQSARACNTQLTGQCGKLASALLCQGCVVPVNDATELDQLRAQYVAANCPPVACPAIACQMVGSAVCESPDGVSATGNCIYLNPE